MLKKLSENITYSNPLGVVVWSQGFSRIRPPKGSTPFHNQFRIAIVAEMWVKICPIGGRLAGGEGAGSDFAHALGGIAFWLTSI